MMNIELAKACIRDDLKKIREESNLIGKLAHATPLGSINSYNRAAQDMKDVLYIIGNIETSAKAIVQNIEFIRDNKVE